MAQNKVFSLLFFHNLVKGHFMLEILQVLKHLYKQDRLDFTSHWVAKEEDYWSCY